MKKYKEVINTPRMQRIEDSLSENDFIFKIKTFVIKLNLSHLEKNFKPSKRGPKPLPLWVPVCVWIYAYNEGVLSYRKVAKLCKRDDHFYWLSGGFCPSQAYLETWKLRVLPMIPGLLIKVLKKLQGKGKIKNKILGLDGVRVPVWASAKQSKTEDMINDEIKAINKNLRHKRLSATEKKKLIRRKEKLIIRKIELLKRKASVDNEETKKKMRINITSPNTAIMKDSDDVWIQGVNLQAIINQNHQLNTYHVSRCPNDRGLLGLMYNKLRIFLNVTIVMYYLLVDSGYWEEDDIKRFDPEKGYKVIIANPKDTAASRNRTCGRKTTGYTIDKFKYNAKRNVYTCANNKILKNMNSRKTEKKYKRKQYRASIKDCKSCPIRKECLGKIKGKSKILTITADEYQAKEIIRLKKYAQLKKNKKLYKRRGIINEPVHAHLFFNKGISKLHCIGGEKIDGEIALLLLIYVLRQQWINGNFTLFFCRLLFLRQFLGRF